MNFFAFARSAKCRFGGRQSWFLQKPRAVISGGGGENAVIYSLALARCVTFAQQMEAPDAD